MKAQPVIIAEIVPLLKEHGALNSCQLSGRLAARGTFTPSLDILDALQVEVTTRPGGVSRVVRGEHSPEGSYLTPYSLNPAILAN